MSLEQLHRGQLRGPLRMNVLSGPQQFAGQATIASGNASVTVSVTTIKSDSMVFATAYAPHSIQAICVSTITDSSYFTLGSVGGGSVTDDTTVNWMIVQIK